MKLNRRTFLSLSALGLTEPIQTTDHFVPLDKKLRPEWVKALTAKGERKVFRDDELKTIGMPCGGVAAGQLYVRGALEFWRNRSWADGPHRPRSSCGS